MNHCSPAQPISESDHALLLIVGYNLFPRPPENEGDFSSVESQLIVEIIPRYRQHGATVCKGDVTLLQSLLIEVTSQQQYHQIELQ